MTGRIKEDHDRFHKVVAGKTLERLRGLISTGKIIGMRPDGKGNISVPIKSIDNPYFRHDDSDSGLLRGPGKEGDVLDDGKGDGDGKGPGGEDGSEEDIIEVQVDLESVLKFMKNELELPEMKPKPNQTYEDIKIKYNDISKNGPESLRHTRRTLREAMKRMAMMNELDQLHYVPGLSVPIRLITPINQDKRYRKYKEIKIPSSNAVIFFARDYSGSMDDDICNIVSDTCWWIETWISQYYKKMEKCYIVHDTHAQEVDSQKFYSLRNGGGTKISSAFDYISQQLENRFPPFSYNVYVFYFTDGDNWGEDNQRMIESVAKLEPHVNLLGFTEVCPDGSGRETAKQVIQKAIGSGLKGTDIKTVSIETGNRNSKFADEEDRNRAIIDAIKLLLAPKKDQYV